MRVQIESADYQHSDGSHGSEVPSEIITHSAVLSQQLSELFLMMLRTLTFYTLIVLFFCRTYSH
jgi:hypothetical protein